MSNRRHPVWSACVAFVAAYALVLSALLSGMVPPSMGRADPFGGQTIQICLSSGGVVHDDKAPDRPTPHLHDSCCVLCVVAGLATIDNQAPVSEPDYQRSRSSALISPVQADPLATAELLPINPRAPPRPA